MQKSEKLLRSVIFVPNPTTGELQQFVVPTLEQTQGVLPENIQIITKREIEKRTGLSYYQVLKLCREQKIKTTIDGRVTEKALADYLGLSNNSQKMSKL